ncbi:hypothetical protein F2Q70_00038520 [Brassica cretica]|nr:hypothetical protein F2Q70_00038520 [Brassica cretica]
MDTRQKEKEKEKDMNPEDRKPKVSGVNREPSALTGERSERAYGRHVNAQTCECSDMVTLNQGLGRFRKVVLVLWPDLTMIGFSMGLTDGLDRHRCNPLVGIIGNRSDLDHGKAKEP